MDCCRETANMGVPPGIRPAVPRDWLRGVPERYVAGADTRGRQEGWPNPWSQQVIHEISGLAYLKIKDKRMFVNRKDYFLGGRVGVLLDGLSFQSGWTVLSST